MLQQVLQFTRNPVYEEDENQDPTYRVVILIKLILLALVISFGLSAITSILESTFDLQFGRHASEDMIENLSTLAIVFLVVIVAPLLEELLFRGPLHWFREKTTLRIALYCSIVLFGLIHLANYEDYTTHWYMAPLLIAPQMSLGMFAGFIRIRFGLLWAMALHAGYNLLISVPMILVDLLNIS